MSTDPFKDFVTDAHLGALQMRRHGSTTALVHDAQVQSASQVYAATQGPTAATEVGYINGLNPDGSINSASYWGSENSTAFKYGSASAGTGATISYAFDAASAFSATEQHTFEAGLAMWASVANLTFVAAASAAAADILLTRGSDGMAATKISSDDGSGTALGHPTSQTIISIDTSVYGFELGGSFDVAGGYGWGTVIHEIGHALGLGHAGQYDGDVDPSTDQYSAYDDRMWTTMSYISWADSDAKYWTAALAAGTDWGRYTELVDGSSYSDERDVAHTVMGLDILAIQQLYGAPVSSPMSGGQVYGFNSNITGLLHDFYDFTINKTPIVTMFNTGTGNTLDLSGFTRGEMINLNAGAFSSVAGLRNNLYIADGTHIDTAIGSASNDTIVANDDGDTLYGGNGSDTLTGGIGNDKIYGGSDGSSDTIHGGGGADYLEGTGSLYGDDGNDYIVGSGSLDGGAGDDQLIGTGSFNGSGGDGNDVLVAGAGISTQHGGAGDDMLIGGAYADVLYGDAGNDTFRGGAGDDTYYVDSQSELVFENAGEGTDTVWSSANFYLYANIENLHLQDGASFGVGNDLNNSIYGNSAANTLLGGGGDDSIIAGAGNDIVYGEAGDDTIEGGGGTDYLVGGDGNDVLQGSNGADAIYGGDGDDILSGDIPKPYTDTSGASVTIIKPDFATDILVGGNGNDILHGEDSLGDYDLMDGGAGDDTYYVDTPNDLTFEATNGGTDTVIAKIVGAGYYLYANVENLILADNTPFGVGNELDNHLTGNAIANYLLGGSGDDVLNGKEGNDVLFGEAGADTFVFEHGTGGDVVGDFVPGTDRIDLSAIGYTWAQVQNSIHENGGSTALDLGGGDFIVLNGVTAGQLHQSDFILSSGSSASSAGDASSSVGDASMLAGAHMTLDSAHQTAHLPLHSMWSDATFTNLVTL